MLIIISQMWKIHLMIVHSWFLTCLVFIKCAHTEKFVILWSSKKPSQRYTWRRAKDAAIYLYDYLLCIYKDCLLQWVFWGLIFFTLILYDIWNKGSSWSEKHLIISLRCFLFYFINLLPAFSAILCFCAADRSKGRQLPHKAVCSQTETKVQIIIKEFQIQPQKS